MKEKIKKNLSLSVLFYNRLYICIKFKNKQQDNREKLVANVQQVSSPLCLFPSRIINETFDIKPNLFLV